MSWFLVSNGVDWRFIDKIDPLHRHQDTTFSVSFRVYYYIQRCQQRRCIEVLYGRGGFSFDGHLTDALC